jgi:hypothetical protein
MKTLSTQAFTRARDFLYSKARPLERAMFAFHFDGGAVDDVLTALIPFQNEDGGFGKALEPDLRTSSSSALATGDGLSILKEVDCPGEHAIVRKALEYLLSSYDNERNIWRIAPRDTNNYPHAPWWHDEDGSLNSTFDGFRVIPRAKIVGTLHHYADFVPEDWLSNITEQTVADIEMITPFGSGGGDDLVYALSLAEEAALPEHYRVRVVTRLRAVVPEVVSKDPADWGSYCISPLKIVTSPHSPVADLISDAVQEHLDYQIDHQTPEGAWDPVWSWGDFYPDVWPQACQEWQGHLTLATLTTLRAFNRIEGVA